MKTVFIRFKDDWRTLQRKTSLEAKLISYILALKLEGKNKPVTTCRSHDTLFKKSSSLQLQTIRTNKLIQQSFRIQDEYTENCCISIH